jgi:transposase
VKEDAVKDAKRYYGVFAFLSNEKMDSLTALKLYRNKDVVEKAFGNLKKAQYAADIGFLGAKPQRQTVC